MNASNRVLSSSIIDSRAAERCFKILGVRVDAVQMPDVHGRMKRWISERKRCHFIAVTGMHGIAEAQYDLSLKRILNSADLVIPDGMPLVWVGRRHGHRLKRRVCGVDLMETFCRETGGRYRHFFCGGAPGVADELAAVFEKKFGISVAGAYCPPFRSLAPNEEADLITRIQSTVPDVVWVGLGTPKQEKWMYAFRKRLRVPVLAGVGAAFDFHTGRLKRAPLWMQENGFEWLFRLLQEPKRLWQRYLVYGSKFTWNLSLELLGLKRFD
jgi:N-acetylglucosaminyldiphosphoundecaprenol N-acetyl-beta-D-mannosaminyltransferase